MATTILLVDDHPLFRKGLRLLLEEQADFRIVGEAGDGRQAIELVRNLSPEVVIMDITMPEFNGIEATREIVSEHPSAKVVALSMHSGKSFVEGMLKAGAAGYILKKSVPEDLVEAVRMVVQGDIYLSPAIAGIVVSEYKELLAKSSATAQIEDSPPILRTKLQRPVLSPDLLPRPDLVERLDELRRRPLTLVSAAAGYGKSTLASQWLEAWDGPYAWLSLEDEENDLQQFLNYLLAAITTAVPGACERVQSLLQQTELGSIPDLSRHLGNCLDEIKDALILVMDNYHLINEKAVHDLLGALLAHPPQNLHLMLLTRRDPPILTSDLRARGQINEIRTIDLRFTVVEIKVLLESILGRSVDDKTAATIQERLEGWPSGMRLISQSLIRSDDLDRLLAGLKGGFQTIVDYLMSEVLSLQSPEMAKWMTATAILDHFCAPLCDELLVSEAGHGAGEMNGDEFITRLQKDNLFLVAEDSENRWFRYHPMFRQLLQDQLNRHWPPEEIAGLHARATAWFAENEMSGSGGGSSPAALTEDGRQIDPGSAGRQHLRSAPPSQPLVEPLTNRELDVLEKLASRLTNKEIADSLHISTTTVKGHLQNVYQKLEVNKRREAVEKAKNLGII
jgi:ATP/maltotriose-dependent transcriptional regulator MalT/ActR/RegA family two-component response regulator